MKNFVLPFPQKGVVILWQQTFPSKDVRLISFLPVNLHMKQKYVYCQTISYHSPLISVSIMCYKLISTDTKSNRSDKLHYYLFDSIYFIATGQSRTKYEHPPFKGHPSLSPPPRILTNIVYGYIVFHSLCKFLQSRPICNNPLHCDQVDKICQTKSNLRSILFTTI